MKTRDINLIAGLVVDMAARENVSISTEAMATLQEALVAAARENGAGRPRFERSGVGESKRSSASLHATPSQTAVTAKAAPFGDISQVPPDAAAHICQVSERCETKSVGDRYAAENAC